MSKESLNPIDVHVGTRIRARRKSLHMSQEQLAEALQLTFQQVQKYERGSNRISASKLYIAAQALKVRPEYFFAGLHDELPSRALVLSRGGSVIDVKGVDTYAVWDWDEAEDGSVPDLSGFEDLIQGEDCAEIREALAND